MNEPLDPSNTIIIAKHKGREVGRIAATARNASQYLQELASHYGELTCDYEENKDAAMISRMLAPR